MSAQPDNANPDQQSAPDNAPTDDKAGKPENQSPPSDDKGKSEIPADVKRALRQANKEAESLRLKLKEYEDRDKSELQKAQEQAEAALFDASKAQLALLREKTGRSFQLSDEAMEFLHGDSEEELKARAEKLAGMLNTSNGTADRRPDPSQGNNALPLNGDPLEKALRSRLGI